MDCSCLELLYVCRAYMLSNIRNENMNFWKSVEEISEYILVNADILVIT